MHKALKRAEEEKVQLNLRKSELGILYEDLKEFIELKSNTAKKLKEYSVFKRFMNEVTKLHVFSSRILNRILNHAL